ncbi:MAG TPA: PAS domain S-box protein [Gemmatimonadales bacterium]|nr:PAS domain S-box protein [Gemmatimonadales bacterium]
MVPALSDLMERVPPAALVALGAVAALALLAAFVAERQRRRRAENAAGAVLSRLRTITASMREGVVAYDMDLRLTLVNPAFERLTGYAAEDLRDQEFLQYIHPDDRPALMAEWERLAQGGALRDQEHRLVTRGGQVRWCASTWEPVRDEAGRQIGYLGTELDITERKQTEHDLRMDVELFQTVGEMQRAVIAAGLESRTVLHAIADRAQALTHADAALIELREGDDLVPRVDTGSPGAPRVETTLSGSCLRTGEVQRCDDTANDRRVDPEVTRRAGVGSVVVVPLKANGRMLGVLKVIAARASAFGDRDVRALRMMAGLMSAALEHAALLESRQARLEERTQTLQESEQRFKQLVDAAQEGICVLDEQQQATYLNPRMAELLGCAAGEIVGRPLYDFVDQPARAAARDILTGRENGARSDLRFRRPDGGDVWAMVSASPLFGRDGARIGTVAMVTDVTERRRAEDRLRRSADRLAMLHDVDQAVLAGRPPAEIATLVIGRLRRMLPAFRAEVVLFDPGRDEVLRLAGFEQSESLPQSRAPLAGYGPPDLWRRGVVQCVPDLAALDAPGVRFRRLLDAGMRSFLAAPLLVDGQALGEISLAAKPAEAFTTEDREIVQEIAAPLALAVQQGRLRDEIARRAAEHERRLADRGAALRELGADVDALIGGLAHEARAPIRQLDGFAALLLEDGGARLDPTARHAAGRVREAAARIAGIVDDLVQLARVGRHEPMRAAVPLAEPVREVVAQLESRLTDRVVEWRVGELPTVQADPTLVRLALGHLLGNAVKFTRTRPRAVIELLPVVGDGEAGLAVRDNGVGFDPAHAGRLFGLFQRLHRPDEFDGHGLGLALVRRVAEKHGGRVWAEGEGGSGATFYLTLGEPQGR